MELSARQGHDVAGRRQDGLRRLLVDGVALSQLSRVVTTTCEQGAIRTQKETVVVRTRGLQNASREQRADRPRDALAVRVSQAELSAVVVAEGEDLALPCDHQRVLATVEHTHLLDLLVLQGGDRGGIAHLLGRSRAALTVVVVARTPQHTASLPHEERVFVARAWCP